MWVKQLQRETDNSHTYVAKVNEYGGWMWCPNKGNGKGKAISIQAWTGLYGTRVLRLPDLKTVGTRMR